MKNANNKNGFSILEMGITLTVISLLIAGTLTGQHLKHRHELGKVITDMGTITSAVKQFRATYGNYYPGDLYNASATWTGALNGDGNGFLSTTTSAPSRNEELLFWQHLVTSGLLSASISGSYDGSTPNGEGGVMVSSVPYGFYYVHKAVNIPSAGMNPTGRLVIKVSKSGGAGLFTTKEAYDFDAKYDNTAPLGTAAASTIAAPSGTLGTISAADGAGETQYNCVVDGTGAIAPTYKLSNASGTPCVLYFYLE